MSKLEINDLQVKVGGELVLDQIDLAIEAGELHVIMGPNGAGKSSLAQVIMGHPNYQITQGKIQFEGQEINDLEPEKRVGLGLGLSYQSPPKVEGVKLQTFLDLISRSRNLDLKVDLEELWPEIIKLGEKELNNDLSGGEKKITEVLQLLVLQPELTIFDELDAGLDLKNWQKMARLIKNEFISSDKAIIFISHQPQLVTELKPDYIHIILDKKLVCSSQDYSQVLTTIKDHDYDQCRHCPSRSS